MKLLSCASKVLFGFERCSTRLVSPTINMSMRKNHSNPMANTVADPFSLSSVVKNLETFAPLHLAESWDNVGLLVEPSSSTQVKRVLLTNDLSESVMEEAVAAGVQLIISYHPLIFQPMKSIRMKNWKERIVGTLLERKIALYSPHTAWDCVEGGVNDWLAEAFGKDALVEPLKKHDESRNLKTVNALFENNQLADAAISHLNAAVQCSIHSFPERNGKVWLKIYVDNEYLCLPSLHSAEKVDISQQKSVSSRVKAGVGRRVHLKKSISLQDAISLVKQHLGLPDVAVAVAGGISNYESTSVQDIALCAGSGGSVLKGIEADLYLTGEMSHHEVLDTVHKGTHVILTRHSNSERGFLRVAAEHHLAKLMPQIEFIVSSADRDPLETK